MMTEIEMSSCRRRKSVPEIVNSPASGDDEDDDDRNMLIDPSNINPNDFKEPEEPIYSRARLSMDGGIIEHMRAKTPEQAFKDDLKPDGAFLSLRPKSPVYIPQYQRYDSTGNSVDHESPSTPPETFDDDINKCSQEDSSSVTRPSKFRIVRSDSNSGRLLVKIPLNSKLTDIDEDVIFDRNTNETTNNNAEPLACPSYPMSLTTYDRGVSPTGKMNLVNPEEPTLAMLRARTKIHYTKDVHNTIDLMKSRLLEDNKQVSIDEEPPSTDHLHMMDESGMIVWDTEDDELDLEDVLGLTLDEMPTMKQEEFQALDQSNIVDAYLTKDYIIIETSS